MLGGPAVQASQEVFGVEFGGRGDDSEQDGARQRRAGRGATASGWTARSADQIFDVPIAIREAMEAYNRRPELAHVVAETAMHGVHGSEPAPQRDRFDAMLRDEVPSLPEHERRLLVAALCHLDSSATWVIMRRELGMNGRDIADTAMWAAEAQLDPIRDQTTD